MPNSVAKQTMSDSDYDSETARLLEGDDEARPQAYEAEGIRRITKLWRRYARP